MASLLNEEESEFKGLRIIDYQTPSLHWIRNEILRFKFFPGTTVIIFKRVLLC
jgi:hypothetical protein